MFEGLLAGIAAAALELAKGAAKGAVWTLGEPEGLLGLTGFWAKVTVSVLEFDRLLANVTVVVLGSAGFATKGITLEPDGLLASVTVVVPRLAGFSILVTVSTVSGFCTKVTVFTLGVVVGEEAADSLAATKVAVAVLGDSAEGNCLAWLMVTVTAELGAADVAFALGLSWSGLIVTVTVLGDSGWLPSV